MIRVVDPATGELIAEVPNNAQAAVDRAVARARQSFESGVWRGQPGSERAKIMWRIADLIEERLERLVDVEARNNGMSRVFARAMIKAGAEMFRYYSGWCTKIHGQATDLLVGGGLVGGGAEYHAYTLLEPIGVAGLIIPWNGPFYSAAGKLAPALAAGCSSVLKPAEETPLTALELGEILAQAGVPAGVVNILTGDGETTGAALASHPGVDKIAFTGSTETGKLIVAAARGNLKRVTLELGGKSPVIIYADADLSRAIPGAAIGIFTNSGQACTAGSRVFAHRDVYREVVQGIAAAGKALRLGGSNDPNADIGPLISARQLERVTRFVEEGRRDGATIVSGGKPLDRTGFFFEPTVVTDVRTDMRLYREEIFGPVVIITPFDDEAAVIAEANNTDYGLAAAIWTRDISRAHRLAKRIDAGTVWINCQVVFDPSMPFGGFKQSGWGHEYGWKGLEIYLKTKSVCAQL
jgi:phenylacetaldehyde dehydrogenase